MGERRLVGHLYLDSGQIFVMDPVNLGTEDEYQRVVEVTLEKKAGEVWLRDRAVQSNSDGVVVETSSDGNFPVYAEYDDDGVAASIYIDLS